VNQVGEAKADEELEPRVSPKNRVGQYRLRLLRSMELPQVAYVLEAWLSF